MLYLFLSRILIFLILYFPLNSMQPHTAKTIIRLTILFILSPLPGIVSQIARQLIIKQVLVVLLNGHHYPHK